MIKVKKRDHTIEEFDRDKIKIAVMRAMTDDGNKLNPIYPDEDAAEKVAKKAENKVKAYLKEWKKETTDIIPVDVVHKMVENSIMDVKLYDVARAYITYRKQNMPDIFRERIAYKPMEYPNLALYVDAIQQSYWIHSEFNYTQDIQDFKTTLKPHEQEAVRRCMLAISQVEVAVKKFWSRIGDRMPKPEIEEVGSVFAESEVRHSRAYSHLLEILGLNSDFDSVLEVPAIKQRVDYAQKALAKGKTESNRDYMESVLLFSLFIENVSLFSQFLIISQMNKALGAIKGMANVVAATSLEEQLHSQFGSEVVNILRKENPEWFNAELEEHLYKKVDEAFEAEKAIIEWIFEEGEFDYLTKDEVIEYIKKRFNKGLEDSGFDPAFDTNPALLERVNWFDVQNSSTAHTDFFSQRSINYTKFDTTFDEDSLF